MHLTYNSKWPGMQKSTNYSRSIVSAKKKTTESSPTEVISNN